MNLNFRYLAQITIEANSAFAINSGRLGLFHDNVVVKDANGLPYIPGTSLAGVLRHAAANNDMGEEIFGKGGEDGFGSRLIVSSALLVGHEGKVIEGLQPIDFDNHFYSAFRQLPYRDHVRINERGTAVKSAKFDEELVYRGSRFVFELELHGDQGDEEQWDSLLNLLEQPEFRIGSGTRKGRGDFNLIREKCFRAVFNLTQTAELKDYLSKTSSLNQPIPNGIKLSKKTTESKQLDKRWKLYTIEIKPKDFFIFGAGYGDEEADRISKREKHIQWREDKPHLLTDDFILIPATSLKGALWHRVAFHYNELTGNYIGKPKTNEAPEKAPDGSVTTTLLQGMFDKANLGVKTPDEVYEKLIQEINAFNLDSIDGWEGFVKELEDKGEAINRSTTAVSEDRFAVNQLFGFAKDSEKIKGKRGAVIIPDIYLPFHRNSEKVLNHVKIDRFTGGALDGALFQEKVYYHTESISIPIWVESDIIQDEGIKKAFKLSLDDLVSGRLPLGGMTAKGHGYFSGTLSKEA